jgi:hypothetical protein
MIVLEPCLQYEARKGKAGERKALTHGADSALSDRHRDGADRLPQHGDSLLRSGEGNFSSELHRNMRLHLKL